MATIYGSVAGADTYHSERGNAAWALASTTDKESALLRASEYIDGHYRGSFQGYRTNGRSQEREWPRTDAYVWTQWTWELLDKNTVPYEVENATYEAALRELATPGFFTPDYTPGKNKKSVKVDSISVEYWSDEQYPVVKALDYIIAPLLAKNGMQQNPLSGKAVIA